VVEPPIRDPDSSGQEVEFDRSTLEAVLRQLPLGVIIAKAPDGRLVLGNDQVDRIWRSPYVPASSIEDYRIYRGLHPDGTPLEPHEWPLARALSSGEIITDEEIDIIRGDDTRATIRVNAAPIRDRGGDISAAVVTFEDVTAQRRVKEALEFLTEASAILSASLDYETTLTSLADLIVPRLADWCVVDIVDDQGAIRRLAMKHRDPQMAPLLEALETHYPHRVDAPGGPARVIRTGQAELWPEIASDAIDRAAVDAEHLEILRSLDIRSYLAVPLIARGRTLGAISFVYAGSGRRYTTDDLALAEELGRRAAVAVDNARLFAAEHASRAQAEDAQRRLLLLAEISNALVSSLDYDATLDRFARLAIPDLADLSVVDIVQPDGSMYRAAVAHVDPQQEALLHDVVRKMSRSISSNTTLSRILRGYRRDDP
jgi:PAS domain-containing protein